MRKSIISLLIIAVCLGAYGSYESTWGNILSNYSDKKSSPLALKADLLWPKLLQELEQASPVPPIKKRKVHMVSTATPQMISPQNSELAFWLNAYNIASVKLLLSSANQVITVDRKVYSPTQIYYDKLRNLGDPRVHFAIANFELTKSKLAGEVYFPRQIKEQLHNQMRLFLSNTERGLRVDKAKRTIYLSKIFKNYESDFIDVRVYLSQNLPEYSKYLLEENYTLRYLL